MDSVTMLNIVGQYGLAGFAVYLMYKLMCKYVRDLTKILSEKMDALQKEIRLLREDMKNNNEKGDG